MLTAAHQKMCGRIIIYRSVHTNSKKERIVCMTDRKRGKQSFVFDTKPVIKTWASIAGKKEGEGPLAATFDVICNDPYFGQSSWELGEKKLQQSALDTLSKKSGLPLQDFDVVVSGDLLNQCIGSSFSLRNTGIPHLGLYGACSTMAESLLLASTLVSGGFCHNAVAMTSSHFASSERQYRFPLGYGGQRTPTSQWTVTGSGAVLIGNTGQGPVITGGTIGTVTDLGIKDANNMGAAMAPAALTTIKAHFDDMNTGPENFDLIVTGDLGKLGKDLLLDLANREGISLGGKLTDCGTLVFDISEQDVHAGGSGCGCSAITLCGYLLERLRTKKLKNILFCGTGALLSPTSTQQGLPIPAICHAVSISGGASS